MQSRIAWIVAGIAVAAVIVWVVSRRDDGTSTPDRGSSRGSSQASASSGAAAAPASAPAAEAAPASTTREPHRDIPEPHVAPVAPQDHAGTPGLGGTFADEPRDDAWAKDTEATLAPRLDAAAGAAHARIAAIECKTRRCRIRVEADDDRALGVAIDKISEHDALAGVAAHMLLTAPQKQPDGTSAIDIYGDFDR